MSNKQQTRVELLHLAYSLVQSGDRHGRGITADEIVAEAEKLERFVNKKPGTVINSNLLVEGDITATGNVSGFVPRESAC